MLFIERNNNKVNGVNLAIVNIVPTALLLLFYLDFRYQSIGVNLINKFYCATHTHVGVAHRNMSQSSIQTDLSAEGSNETKNLLELESKAKHFVDEILKNAILILNTMFSTSVTIQSISQTQNSRMPQQIQNSAKEIFLTTMPVNRNKYEMIWPKISEFKIDDAIACIERYIHKWNMTEQWSITVNFISQYQNENVEFFQFLAIFQLPMDSSVATAVNAKIRFTFELNRMIDGNGTDLPRVTYQFDGMNSIYPANMKMLNFQEKFLKMTIQLKMDLFRKFVQNEVQLYSPQ